jgi:hypothetical protein
VLRAHSQAELPLSDALEEKNRRSKRGVGVEVIE